MALRAGIDIGTNTILLLVAEVNGREVRALEDMVTVVRLGQGVDKNRAFHPDAMMRARECFARYAEVLKKYPGVDVRAFATSGSRDAANSAEFFSTIERDFGIKIRVISGDEEALLSFRGALPEGEADPESMAVLDIGGGSSEIVGAEDGALFRFSFDMGCVRLSERFLKSDPASSSQIQELEDFVRAELGRQKTIFQQLKGKSLVGVAGTATYLASSAMGLREFESGKVHGRWVTAEEVSRLVEEFSLMTADQRLGRGGMDKGRADVILAGAIILREILSAGGFAGYRASVWGLRYGAVL